MMESEIRKRATELLSELMQIDSLATSPGQRRTLKDARNYLQRAIDTGADAPLKLGSYYLGIVTAHIHEVQAAKRKGAERAARRDKSDGDKV
jgi:hypothetical protein